MRDCVSTSDSCAALFANASAGAPPDPFFAGKGPNDRDYKRGANLKFEKGVGAKYLELKITDRQRKAQPEFAIKDWE